MWWNTLFQKQRPISLILANHYSHGKDGKPNNPLFAFLTYTITYIYHNLHLAKPHEKSSHESKWNSGSNTYPYTFSCRPFTKKRVQWTPRKLVRALRVLFDQLDCFLKPAVTYQLSVEKADHKKAFCGCMQAGSCLIGKEGRTVRWPDWRQMLLRLGNHYSVCSFIQETCIYQAMMMLHH